MKKNSAVALIAIITLIIVVYSNSLHAQFQYDDYQQIVLNDGMKHLSNIPKFFASSRFGSQHQWGRGYRPLTYSSFTLNYAISQNDPWSYHAFNIILHIINSFLVYLIIRRILSAYSGNTSRDVLPVAAAIIFALHPVQTNAVTYVSGRAVLLAAAFGLFSFYSFLRYRESKSGTPWVVAAVLSFALALLSKEIAVSIPALMLFYCALVPSGGKKARSGLMLFALFAVTLATYLVVRKLITGSVTSPYLPYGRFEYIFSQVKATVLYMKLMLAPINQNADWSLPVTMSIDINSVLSVLLIAAFTATLLILMRTVPVITFFGLWWLVALAPEALIVPITDIAVEYRMYIPSIGFIAALVILADRIIKNKTALKASLVVLALLLGILTITRNEVWATQKTFWADVVKKTPGSSRAHANYGSALYAEGQYAEAIAELYRAISLNPVNTDNVYALNSLGLCYMRLGLDAEAEAEFKKALMLEQEVEEPYINLSVLYHQQGRYAEEADVLRMLINAIPGSVLGRRNLIAVENMMRSSKPESH